MKNAVRIARDKNPLYPLPSDYAELSDEGKRQARVNAASYFLVPTDNADERASNLVTAVNFFDMHYLRGSQRAGFYDLDVLPTPDFHHRIIWNMGRYKRTVTAAPRGYAKSNLVRKLMLTVCTARPNYGFFYATGSEKFVKLTMRTLFRQWTENSLIFDDFASEPEYNGSIRPPRGNPFGLEHITLNNGASVFATSAHSRNRGGRPVRYILDDPEYDPDKTTSMVDLREFLEEFIFKVIGPMVEHPGRGIDWLGTIISQHHYLQIPFEDQFSGQLEETRFSKWCRARFQMAYPSIDDPREFLWPELHGPDALKNLIETYSRSYVMSEFFNLPMDNAVLSFTRKSPNHIYTIEPSPSDTTDPLTDPFSTHAVISYTDQEGHRVSHLLPEFLRWCPTCITVDWAIGLSAQHDFSAIAVAGITPENELFVLDLFVGRVEEDDLARRVIDLARKWRPRVIGVENQTFGGNVEHKIATHFEGASEWRPRVHTLRHYRGAGDKGARINALKFRFGFDDSPRHHGLIKLPAHRESELPFHHLLHQIDNFNPYAPNNGLRHDDALDAVAMTQELILGKPNRPHAPAPTAQTARDKLFKGVLHDENGDPLIGQVDFNSLTSADLQTIITAASGPHAPLARRPARLL